MFKRRLTLFRLLGFAVRVDASWLIIAVLITFWWMGAAGGFRRPAVRAREADAKSAAGRENPHRRPPGF